MTDAPTTAASDAAIAQALREVLQPWSAGTYALIMTRAAEIQAARTLEAQPSGMAGDCPDDATNLEVIEYFVHVGRTMKPVGHWPGERLYAAIERVLNTPRQFITDDDKVPYRGHNGRGGDADQALPPFRDAPPIAQQGGGEVRVYQCRRCSVSLESELSDPVCPECWGPADLDPAAVPQTAALASKADGGES